MSQKNDRKLIDDVNELAQWKAEAIKQYEKELEEARKEAMKIDWSKVGKPGPDPEDLPGLSK